MKRISLTVKTVDRVKSIFFKSDTKNNFQGSKIRERLTVSFFSCNNTLNVWHSVLLVSSRLPLIHSV